MKVTLTDKGVDYIKQLMFDNMNESQSYPVKRYLTSADRPYNNSSQLSHVSLHFGHTVPIHSGSLSAPLLDTLLPAMLAANPPREVEIHQPRISISPTFQKHYLVSSPSCLSMQGSLQLGAMSAAKMGRTFRGASDLGIPTARVTGRLPDVKTARLRLLRTLQAFKIEKPLKQFSQVENAAAAIISKTLRLNKLVERQEAIRKKRKDIASRHKDLIRKTEIEDTMELDGKTQLIEKINAIEAMQTIRDTKLERYRVRLQRKHLNVEGVWGRQKSLAWLASPVRRRISVPYTRLAGSQKDETLGNSRTASTVSYNNA